MVKAAHKKARLKIKNFKSQYSFVLASHLGAVNVLNHALYR